MNQRKAKQLRKMANFHPGDERTYIRKNVRKNQEGQEVSWTVVATDARRTYKTLKGNA